MHYRDSVDRAFADPERTILNEVDLATFSGIDYFVYDTAYRVRAVFEPLHNQTRFKMKTTTERLPEYLPAGRITFTVSGELCSLTVYKNLELAERPGFENYLFLPFTDATNGEETYGGGRYLDFKNGIEEGAFELDFNRAYNPYCVYHDRYSCPIPPAENHLNVAIRAGVKKFSRSK